MTSQGKRLSLFSLPEVQELYSVPQFNQHERDYFFTLTDEEYAAVNRLNSYRNRIHLVLMLGYFKVKPVCLVYGWKDIADDYRYVAERYFPSASKQNKNIDRQTRGRLYHTVFSIVGYQRYDQPVELELLTYLNKRATLYVDETQLFKDMVALLESKQVAIPRYSTLQKVISSVVNTEEARLAALIGRHLSNKDAFFQLIDRNEKNYRLKDLKKLTKAYKPGEIKKELGRHRMLSELSVDALGLMEKLKLSDGNIRYFATRCQQYDISRLRELKREKALIYLTCFVTTRLRISNDSLTQSFLVAYKDFNDQAVAYRDEQVKQQALALLGQIEKVPQVLNLFVDNTIEDSDEFGTVRRRAFNLIARDQLPLVSQLLAKVKPDKAVFQWDYIDTHFAQVTRNIRPLLLALDFGCRSNTVLERHIASVKATLKLHPPSPPIDGRLVKRGDKKYLTMDSSGDENDKRRIANRHEMYLYKLLNTALHNGDLYVKNSLEFRSFDDYLVNDAIWRQRNKYLHEAGLGWMMQSSGDYLATLKDTLSEKIASVGQRIAAGKNTYIKRKPNSDTLLWSRAVTPKDHTLTERFFAHFDRKTIVNVVRKVNEETGFLEHFKPTSNRHKKSAASVENLLACVIANGTFQGTHRFSAVSDQQYKVLKRIEDDCFHDAALCRANDAITGAAVRLPIFDEFKMSDGETHGSADGQRYESKHGNPLVDYAAKYYASKKGAIVYTLVASHFATQGKVISARSHESHHVFDVVYNNTSDLKAHIISTDTHGTNQFNHALLNTFGYRFTPRYAGFKKRFLAEFNVSFDKDEVLSLAKSINWKLIQSEWENIVKIMLSLGRRTVQQSTLVKKLCGYQQHNATMLALAEYNRVFKCLHLLDYANDKQLRQVIQESLNRGESVQGLKRALASLGGNQFRGRNPEEMAMWNSCANLLTNCIVYYNALIMSSYKSYCLDAGNEDQIKHLRLISPASWENIILNGYYDMSDNDEHWNIESEMKGLKLAA